MAIAVANRSEFKSASLKETKFNYTEDWNLYSLGDLLKSNNDPSNYSSGALSSISVSPKNSIELQREGVSADEFIEKPAFYPIKGDDNSPLYFSLFSDKLGSNEDPLEVYNAFTSKNLAGNDNRYNNFSDQTLSNNLGMCSVDSSVSNLIAEYIEEDSLWRNCNREEGIGFNIVMDQKGKKIVPIDSSADVVFSHPFTLNGSYCFSGYFRFVRSDNPSTAAVLDSTTHITFGFFDSNGNEIEAYPITNLNSKKINNKTYYEITQDWCELAVAVKSEESKNIYIKIEWPFDVDGIERPVSSYLKMAGIRLDSNLYPNAYDFRHLKAHDEKRQFPALFDLSSSINNFDLNSNDWTLIYSRYLRYPHTKDFTYYDCIGDIYFGLDNKSENMQDYNWSIVIYQPKHTEIDEETGIKEVIGKESHATMTYDPAQNWGYNIIEKEGDKLTFTMLDLNNCPEEEPDNSELYREISISDTKSVDSSFTIDFLRDGRYSVALGISPPIVGSDDYDVLGTLIPVLDPHYVENPDSTIAEVSDKVLNDLNILYGKPSDPPIESSSDEYKQLYLWRDLVWPDPEYRGILGTIYPTRYRDMIFIPRILKEKERNDLKNIVFQLTSTSGRDKYGQGTGDHDKVSLRSSNFSERAELNIRNQERISK